MNQFNVNKNLQPNIVHLSFSNNPDDHFEYMRMILKHCYGNHSIHTFENYPKDNVDLYITEHFMSTRKYLKDFPYKKKTINVIHSVNCIPSNKGKNFLCQIALTNTWKKRLRRKGIRNIKVIPGGINLESYKNVKYNPNLKTFGRLTRWSSSKIPTWWNDMVKDILDMNENYKCLMYIDIKSRSRTFLKHDRMIYDQSCKIHHFKGDYLKHLGLYVHANGTFRDIMSNAIVEAMATGLPIIYLNENSTKEVIDYAGIIVYNKSELKRKILKMLNNRSKRIRYSQLSKKRVKDFDVKFTIERYNELIKMYV